MTFKVVAATTTTASQLHDVRAEHAHIISTTYSNGDDDDDDFDENQSWVFFFRFVCVCLSVQKHHRISDGRGATVAFIFIVDARAR